jgi:hypothetical protein
MEKIGKRVPVDTANSNINVVLVNSLFEAIKHGDETHQKWLLQALTCFFSIPKADIPPVALGVEKHGCTNCYENNKGFHLVKNGTKKCDECGGTVLFLPELMDYIAAQQSEIRSMKEIYG